MRNLFILLGIILLCSACEPWDLERRNFIRVELLEIAPAGLTSVIVAANLHDLEIGQISDHGFVYSTIDETPTLLLNEGHESLGIKKVGDNLEFGAEISNLLPDTRYFIRAYAMSEGAPAYSQVREFQTSLPGVFTDDIQYEGQRSLIINGHLSRLESGIIGARHGFCWSTKNPSPTLDDDFVDLGNKRTGSTFSYTLTDLVNNTPIYFRAFAELNVNGTLRKIFGDVLTFDGNLWDVWEFHATAEVLSGYTSSITAFTIGEQAYIYGSGNNDEIFIQYDPVKSQWLEKTKIDQLFHYNIGTLNSFSIAGQGYLYNHNMRFFRYDPDQNIWHKLANRPASYDTHRIFSAVYNNKVYMGYGRNSEDVYSCPGIRDWWVFDAGQNCDADSSPSLNCWTERVATAPNRIDALGFTLGKKIYFGLGIDYTGCRKGIEVKLQDWWAYDPEIDAWEPKKAFPGIPGSPITSFTLNNKGYVYCNNGDLWEYIPNTDEWQIRTRLQVYPPDDYNYYRNRALSFTVNGNEYVLMLAPNEIPQIWIYDNN